MNNSRLEGLTDEELISMYRDGDDAVSEFLCNKYKNIARYKARSMYILGAEPEDLIQEGMIGLFKAVNDYDPGRDASFRTFAELCISRQIYKAVEAAGRMKSMPLNSYISLNSDGEDSTKLIDSLASTLDINPEEIMISLESLEELEEKITAELSPLERQVYDLKLTGMDMAQIAGVLGKDKKSVDNALQRIHTKVKRLL